MIFEEMKKTKTKVYELCMQGEANEKKTKGLALIVRVFSYQIFHINGNCDDFKGKERLEVSREAKKLMGFI